jgi:hypothetical protein
MARKAVRRKGVDGNATGGKAGRFAQLNTATSQIVREAAALLDDEVALGIVAARQMQERFSKERRIDPADFRDSLQRFQADAHEVVNMLNQQFAELRSAENADLVSRFVANTHDLLDVVVGVVTMGAEIADQLVAANLPKPRATAPRATRRR